MLKGGLRPGQGFKTFSVFKRKRSVSQNGRASTDSFSPSGEILGLLATASRGDIQQWRAQEKNMQEQHAVLYKIIQPGAPCGVVPGDLLVLGDRKFVVKNIHDPAGLHHFTVYFSEERLDLYGGNFPQGNP